MTNGYDRRPPTFLFQLWHPLSWPRWTRRVFVLCLPLALPVWIFLNLAAGVGAALRVLKKLWDGGCRFLGQPLGQFWNGRQRRYYRYPHRRGGEPPHAPRSGEGIN